MTSSALCNAGEDSPLLRGSPPPGMASTPAPSNEPTLDQLLAEPIVQQLMRRDQIDETTIRDLLRHTAAARKAARAEDELNTGDLHSIARLLHETARLWCSRHDRAAPARLPGMICARCTILIYLAHEGVGQAALGETLDISLMTLARMLDRLEANGLVVRLPAPDDRRAYVLALTAKALPIIERIYELSTQIYDELLLEISEAEDRQGVVAER